MHFWTFDGNDIKSSTGAVVKWENHQFFKLTYQGVTYHGELMEDLSEDNKLQIKINQRVFHVKKKGELDELIASLGLDKPKVRQLKELNAPMPGRIVNIHIQIGQSLNPGDEILSLEAMKMENILKAEGTGIVKSISVTTNQVVEKGAVLVEFE